MSPSWPLYHQRGHFELQMHVTLRLKANAGSANVVGRTDVAAILYAYGLSCMWVTLPLKILQCFTHHNRWHHTSTKTTILHHQVQVQIHIPQYVLNACPLPEQGIDHWGSFRDHWCLEQETQHRQHRMKVFVVSIFGSDADPGTQFSQDGKVKDNGRSQERVLGGMVSMQKWWSCTIIIHVAAVNNVKYGD